ncbi:MAG: M48 family metalloprotease [Betaproteobacteria bacterium]|nr:M48 family metalloprotease [Betaproteobacteria bacterium]MDE2209015.1 M48 family metalloprotease [Betaproteobacteria bacterium]MDE2358384.1 M48 family metalloprotease [Betaproteobacteria bacterium]
MKRIFLFLATNLAVLLVLSIVLRVLGLDRALAAQGLQYGPLLAFSAVVGFVGAFVSLQMSKPMAKWSTGPLQSMSKEEVEAVLGHEMAHVANGDMVTLTLIQGVVNTFVVFLSRVVGSIVDRAVFRNDQRSTGAGYFITIIVCPIAFGVLASMIVAYFSRRREFRADAGSARLLGSPQPMMHALARLGGLAPGRLPQSLQASGITGGGGVMALFASHPPIEARIAALQGRAAGAR